MPTKRVIYAENQETFFKDVLLNKVANKMQSAAEKYGLHPQKPELASWQNNAPRIKSLLELSQVSDTYVTFEYLIPSNMKRIDCMIYGEGNNSQNVVHIELKQWSNNGVKSTSSDSNFEVFNVTAYTGGGYRIVAHPSQQVRGYNDYLSNFVDVISSGTLKLKGVAYCYNYTKLPGAALYDPIYKDLLQEYKTYSGNEVEDLAADLRTLLCDGHGLEIFNTMMQSSIKPSKKLLEEAANLVHNHDTKTFALIDDQIVARNMILDKIRKNRGKSVIIVKGGPGTGKTVIALHILAELSAKQYNLRYVTKSKPLLEGVKHKLPRGSKAKLLFNNAGTFIPAKCNENEFDLLLVDEAHRMAKSANNQYTPASMKTDLSQLEIIVRAAKTSVFFIDDLQAIRSTEIGSTELIKEIAKTYGAKVEEVELKSQFRCNGSDNYLDWLNDVLYNKPITHHFSQNDFDFRIFETPDELYDFIKSQDKPDDDPSKNKSARLTAGFCWPWSDDPDPETGDIVKDIKIGTFEMPWETKDKVYPYVKNLGYPEWYEWAYQPKGIEQVGCIYTAQGFEFDYIGVILGPDIYYDVLDKCIKVDKNAIADRMLRRSGDGIDTYVRNIYRVLMSRGMKGCGIYVCDKPLEKYLRSLL